jgi:hypothetical protein
MAPFNRCSITPLKDFYREDDLCLDHSQIKAALRLSSKDSDIAKAAKDLQPGPPFDTRRRVKLVAFGCRILLLLWKDERKMFLEIELEALEELDRKLDAEDDVNYDENGFLIAIGKGDKGDKADCLDVEMFSWFKELRKQRSVTSKHFN